jgi:hypothetical protein
MAAGATLLFLGVTFVATYFTPLVWSGYILFIDAVLHRVKGNSLLVNRRREFFVLLLLSVLFWLVFEFYNLFLHNWHYVGLPEQLPWRLFGYLWAFATIWPAILETAEALECWKGISGRAIRPWKITRLRLALSVCFGAFCLAVPLLASPGTAHYLAAPVWLGFIFLLDPLNYRMGRGSLLIDLEKGDPRRLYALLLSGVVCGVLWEFWNYWAGAKWHYTVPILGDVKVFEMPVLGYFGFPPFAVECYTMYSFARNIYRGGKQSDG